MSEIMFRCPVCGGYHFNVGVDGQLYCCSVTKFTDFEVRHGGCGWSGSTDAIADLRSRNEELEVEVTSLELSCTEWEHKAREYAKDVKNTWKLAQAKGQTEAYRLLEDMVRRVGYDTAIRQEMERELADEKSANHVRGLLTKAHETVIQRAAYERVKELMYAADMASDKYEDSWELLERAIKQEMEK